MAINFQAPKTKQRKVTPVKLPVQYTPYKCPELGRTCLRPNAYDAFDLPSVYAGERKPYRFADKT